MKPFDMILSSSNSSVNDKEIKINVLRHTRTGESPTLRVKDGLVSKLNADPITVRKVGVLTGCLKAGKL